MEKEVTRSDSYRFRRPCHCRPARRIGSVNRSDCWVAAAVVGKRGFGYTEASDYLDSRIGRGNDPVYYCLAVGMLPRRLLAVVTL